MSDSQYKDSVPVRNCYNEHIRLLCKELGYDEEKVKIEWTDWATEEGQQKERKGVDAEVMYDGEVILRLQMKLCGYSNYFVAIEFLTEYPDGIFHEGWADKHPEFENMYYGFIFPDSATGNISKIDAGFWIRMDDFYEWYKSFMQKHFEVDSFLEVAQEYYQQVINLSPKERQDKPWVHIGGNEKQSFTIMLGGDTKSKGTRELKDDWRWITWAFSMPLHDSAVWPKLSEITIKTIGGKGATAEELQNKLWFPAGKRKRSTNWCLHFEERKDLAKTFDQLQLAATVTMLVKYGPVLWVRLSEGKTAMDMLELAPAAYQAISVEGWHIERLYAEHSPASWTASPS